jgi:hypothetical protein
MHTDGVAKGQRRKGRPLPTRYASRWGVPCMILAGSFFLLVGFQIISVFNNWGSGLIAIGIGASLIYWRYLIEKR